MKEGRISHRVFQLLRVLQTSTSLNKSAASIVLFHISSRIIIVDFGEWKLN
jgi:hypothetical protein